MSRVADGIDTAVVGADELLDRVRLLHADGFDVYTILYNLQTKKRLHLCASLPGLDPVMPTLIPAFRGANWFERELFDMYGVRFEGHPDLRRILMPDSFPDFPLRREYPMEGTGAWAAPSRAIGGGIDGHEGQIAVNYVPSQPKP